MSLEEHIKAQAHHLGFALAGITTCEAPAHVSRYEEWLADGMHGEMHYLASERARAARANPRLLLPECESILVLGLRYNRPLPPGGEDGRHGKIAAYAWGDDYHDFIPRRLQALVTFIETQVGHAIPNRWYTDTGPILERDLAQRAGLGWIGKNTCLIAPGLGSHFFLSEILLGLPLRPDPPFASDHCGTCTRCIEACPTGCILPNRTLNAQRCISYLTIENKGEIPEDLRPQMADWIFGCDVCQRVCPWNQRFAAPSPEPACAPRENLPSPELTAELRLTPQEFNRKFKGSPIKRTKRRGYLRNVAVALGNAGTPQAIPALQAALSDSEPLVREHARWALKRLEKGIADTQA
ncbi:MAG: tRNA epoxyqueuosine(34) reductase QueG [Anaerolineales bacterium]